MKDILRKIKLFVNEPCCAVGFIDNSNFNETPIKPHVKWIKGVSSDRWYADPFILNITNRIIEVLVERFRYEDGKGVLSRIEIDRSDNRLIKESVIFELPTHLSFPFIYEENDKIYIMPENYQ